MKANDSGTPEASPIRVLLAEDETHLGTILQQYLSARGFDVSMVRDGRAALEALRAESFDVALLDIMMPEMDGLDVLREVRLASLPPEVIVITGNGTSETALTALKLGAYDFLSKPYRMAEVEAIVRRAWEKRMLVHDNQVMRERLRRNEGETRFVTQYAPLMAVWSMIRQVAPGAANVSIVGEQGTGKRLVASLMHRLGARSGGPFIDLQCARVSAALQSQTLFGAEAPDADHRRWLGALEQARGGTIYLDRIESLELPVQAMLARALDEGAFVRVGGRQRVRLAARLVVSSSTDLARLAHRRQFHAALLQQVTAIQVGLPPLRERLVDVAPLAEHFAARLGQAARASISPDAIDALERYRWPGNVSELRHVIERAVLVAEAGRVEAGDLVIEARPGGGSAPGAGEGRSLESLEALERRHIAAVLERMQWHQGRAANVLGISPKTLYRKIREFGLARPSLAKQ